ncbi:hypothetical protein F511_27639 [Dorcoceras hygrometricum]|uniref:Uncharacterized protein n=1 Tax=Dorcoceras hygrometricum TaxID=472368 RepID=A0A2Z7BHJ8_9LAMI|nr:hypothetical protein F511_27639 [Dorcoceras hygrometricum]
MGISLESVRLESVRPVNLIEETGRCSSWNSEGTPKLIDQRTSKLERDIITGARFVKRGLYLANSRIARETSSGKTSERKPARKETSWELSCRQKEIEKKQLSTKVDDKIKLEELLKSGLQTRREEESVEHLDEETDSKTRPAQYKPEWRKAGKLVKVNLASVLTIHDEVNNQLISGQSAVDSDLDSQAVDSDLDSVQSTQLVNSQTVNPALDRSTQLWIGQLSSGPVNSDLATKIQIW